MSDYEDRYDDLRRRNARDERTGADYYGGDRDYARQDYGSRDWGRDRGRQGSGRGWSGGWGGGGDRPGQRADYGRGMMEDMRRYARGDYGREDYGRGGSGEGRREYSVGDYGADYGSRDYGNRDYGARDYGGRDYGPGYYQSGLYGQGSHGAGDYGGGRSDWGGRGRRDYGRDEERGWMDKAGDEVASWFGDEDAERRRRMDEMHRGRGPRGYTRSDERIREDVNDRLTDDRYLDASDIDVTVSKGEVTLNGHVDNRSAKRRAEDIAESVSGARHVQNNLRVRERSDSTTGVGTSAGASAMAGLRGGTGSQTGTSQTGTTTGTTTGATTGARTETTRS